MKKLILLLVLFSMLTSCGIEDFKDYYDTGELKVEGKLKMGIKSGTWIMYHKSGSVKTKVTYNNSGIAEGETISWYENGQMSLRGSFKDGKLSGHTEIWHTNGEKKETGVMIEGEKRGRWIFYDTLGYPIDTTFFGPLYKNSLLEKPDTLRFK